MNLRRGQRVEVYRKSDDEGWESYMDDYIGCHGIVTDPDTAIKQCEGGIMTVDAALDDLHLPAAALSRQTDRRRQSRQSGADDHHVKFHRFTFHAGFLWLGALDARANGHGYEGA